MTPVPRLVASLACLLLAAGAACQPSLRNFGAVEEGRLYRSGRLEPDQLRAVIQQHGLRSIVDLGAYDNAPDADVKIQALADELGVTRYTIQMLGDGRANPNGYVAALRLMADSAREPMLVMCAGGTERTGVAVVLYRHVLQGMLIQRAYLEAMEFGHRAEDYEMLAYLADWADEIAEAFRTGSWVPELPPVEPKPGENVDARPAPSQWVPPDYG